jgi:hypothetical protein
MFSDFFFRKSSYLWENVEKYGGARATTNDVKVWRIRIACLISKATLTHARADAHPPGNMHARARAHTHTQILQYFLLFHGNNNSRIIACLICH